MDERNFRSYYYEKVGFRAVEEKKSIELLLKDKPLDVDKLRQYCLRFHVSARYRYFLWKVILGILPINQELQEVVTKNQQEQYDILRQALVLMKRVDNDTPLQEVFLKMYLVEEGMLPFLDKNIMTNKAYQAYLSIAKVISTMVEDSMEAYWIVNRFYRLFRKIHVDFVTAFPEKVKTLLKKEDIDQKLWNHFAKLEVWSVLPLNDWFMCCFSSILPEHSFERIVDTIIGGSSMILVYVAVALLLTHRRPLLIMNSKVEITKYLSQIHEDSGDILINRALEMWEKHGNHVTKSDSPVGQHGHHLTKSDSPVGQHGHHLIKSDSPVGQHGHHLTKSDSPVGQV